MSKSKEKIIILGLILIMIIAVIGVSYAAFRYTGTGTKVNSITSGAIMMTYTESDNVINMTGALPTTDATGTVRLTEGEYFDFTISSNITGNVNINYEISAKDVTVSDRKIDGSNIKLYLTRITEDGTEEELMSPETYNEEATANDYTGRPAGEMSLYASSMNSSETNNYRLRMYVTEEYNPQGDGGGLEFSIKINVYGKDGDKYVPSVLDTLLANNPLQEEKESMFNYASNGTQYDPNDKDDYATDPNPEYITNGLYSREDEDGVSYYFRGDVDNIIQFGEYEKDYYVYKSKNSNLYYQSLDSCQENTGNADNCLLTKLASQGDKMYWNIIRVNGDGSLRLIYLGPGIDESEVGPVSFAENDISGVIGNVSYNLGIDDPKYTGYTYDDGVDSFIKREIDTWYANSLGNTAYDSMVILGRFCSDSSKFLEQEGNILFSSYDRLGQVNSNFAKDNAPTLKCPETSESYGGSYRLKAGLITADELVLAGENLEVFGNSYLNSGDDDANYWSMTPLVFSREASTITWVQSYLLAADYVYYTNVIRPVINVKTEGMTLIGEGTAQNPYVLVSQ